MPPEFPPTYAASASPRVIRLIALVEALKGLLVLLAATGLLALIHQDLHDFAARLILHAHLNPAAKYPKIFLDAASDLSQTRLLWLAAGAALYAGLRLLEAYGLFRGRSWAEWLAALSSGIYVPFEVMELIRQPAWLSLGALVVNGLILAVMVRALLRRKGLSIG